MQVIVQREEMKRFYVERRISI